MTQISRDDVLGLARLSSLALTDDEVDALTVDISNIINYINSLSELDTSNVEPTYQVSGRENIWREDEIRAGVSREDLLSLAPESLDDQIKVPKVL